MGTVLGTCEVGYYQESEVQSLIIILWCFCVIVYGTGTHYMSSDFCHFLSFKTILKK